MRSMTAFAQGESLEYHGKFICEIRSLNHRYLDVQIFLPEIYSECDTDIRKLIQNSIKRGRVECRIKISEMARGQPPRINIEKLDDLATLINQIAVKIPSYQISHRDVLQWPGVMTNSVQLENDRQTFLKLVQNTLTELNTQRMLEGDSIAKFFLDKLTLMDGYLKEIELLIPQITNQLRDRLLARIKEYGESPEPERFQQEILYHVQRADVTEELERLKTHLSSMKTQILDGRAEGKRFDFVIQEIHREANTLCSKSNDAKLTSQALEIKVLNEQLREQIQNVE